MYRLLFDLGLRHLEPEHAHALASRSLANLRRHAAGRALLARAVGPTDPRLTVHALGRTFPSPIGVAAGVDKDASWYEELGALGFGFVEIGTVTALAQPGNPHPRIVRFPSQRALVNRMGFPNQGADAVAARLRRRPATPILGVNVGRSKSAFPEDAAADYRATVRLLGPYADYLVVNVSSPNTPGLRDLQAVETLRPLLSAIRDELDSRAPLLVKIAPDLGDAEIDAITALALERHLDGIVAVNTTLDRSALGSSAAAIPFEGGGVSGRPLGARAVEVLRRIRAQAGEHLTLISVGGVEGADDVWLRLRAGASLVQVYTGFVYGGPAWPRRVNRDLARKVQGAGLVSIEQIIGADAGVKPPPYPESRVL